MKQDEAMRESVSPLLFKIKKFVDQGASLLSAYQFLNPDEKIQFIASLEYPRYLAKLLAFSLPTDPEIFYDHVQALGYELKQMKDGEALAAHVFSVLVESQGHGLTPRGAKRLLAEAKRQRQIIMGQGPWLERAVYRGSKLADEVVDFKMLLPLYGSTHFFRFTYAGLLGRLIGRGAPTLLSVGKIPQVLAAAGATSLEVPFFVASNRWLSSSLGEPVRASWSDQLQSAAIFLPLFKIPGWLAGRTMGVVHGIKGLGGEATRFLPWVPVTKAGLPQLYLGGTMMANHYFIGRLGFEPPKNTSNLAVDAVADVVSLGVGLYNVRRVIGGPIEPLSAGWDYKARVFKRYADLQGKYFGLWAKLKGKGGSWWNGGGWAPANVGAGVRMPEIQRIDPVGNPVMMMQGVGLAGPAWRADMSPQDRRIALGVHLYQLSRDHQVPRVVRRQDQITNILAKPGNGDVLAKVMQFTDVLPDTLSDREVVEKFAEYFPFDFRFPREFIAGAVVARVIRHLPFLHGPFARAIRSNIETMGHRYIMAEKPSEVGPKVLEMMLRGQFVIVDILGENVVRVGEEQIYLSSYDQVLDSLQANASEIKVRAEANRVRIRSINAGRPLQIRLFKEQDLMDVQLSVKISSFYSQFNPFDPQGTVDYVVNRLIPLIDKIRRVERTTGLRIGITFDAEHYAVRDTTNAIFKTLFDRPEYRDMSRVGIVVQAYTKDSRKVLTDLEAYSEGRKVAGGAPSILIRLVKGANLDVERLTSAWFGFADPIFDGKWKSDVSYNEGVDYLLGTAKHLRAAFGSHNLQSLARALDLASTRNVPIEVQMLYGMADRYLHAMVQLGVPVAVYSPVGDMMRGMAYLARRMLENSSQDSFLRQTTGVLRLDDLKRLLQDPLAGHETEWQAEPKLVEELPPAKVTNLDHSFQNEPVVNFVFPHNREVVLRQLAASRLASAREREDVISIPAIIGGDRVSGPPDVGRLVSRNPSNPREIIGVAPNSTYEMARKAVQIAHAELYHRPGGLSKGWAEITIEERAAKLLRVAYFMRHDRVALRDLIIREAGKTADEADKDIAEAIDFLEFYARDAVAKAKADPSLAMKPKGVAAIIAPWNFPLAILTGMSSAALVTGNTVILKPAPQTPKIAFRLTELYHAAGIPVEAVHFLPGGRETGEYLRSFAEVQIVAFTGSMAAGVKIYQADTPRGKTVLAEMGGKNFLVVASDAHSDDIVRYVKQSKLLFSGQKCSALDNLIVLAPVGKAGDDYFETLVARIKESFEAVQVGDAGNFANYTGAVTDHDALLRLHGRIQAGVDNGWGELILDGRMRQTPPELADTNTPYFLRPTIFKNVKVDSPLFQEEYFGPVLNIVRVKTREEAVRVANATRFALTGGVVTRSPDLRRYFAKTLKAGNLYFDRAITGSIVGRQPFGGFYLSGVGAKAGGHDYLWQFVKFVPKKPKEEPEAFEGLEKMAYRVQARVEKPFYYQPGLPGEVNKVSFLPRTEKIADRGLVVVSPEMSVAEAVALMGAALLTGNNVAVAIAGPAMMETGIPIAPKKGSSEYSKGSAIYDALYRKFGRDNLNFRVTWVNLKPEEKTLVDWVRNPHIRWLALGYKTTMQGHPLVEAAVQMDEGQNFLRPVITEDPWHELPEVINKMTRPQTITRNTARHGYSDKSDEKME
ncbi:MAG: bifunctional proline dehydrogenase/L-glutamate gamma-semialdehyde dehydrogenase [Deltaproteobacteria bacterium]|nr:bifunctional proline dehydrogenase/L-glutamate gamma-semialdehyde dehydrogenase [Deltaproteobacteria bacterium]